MSGNSIQYSVLPEVNKLLVPDRLEGESRLQILNSALTRIQMNLSRLVMYEPPSDRVTLVHDAMSVIADVFDTLSAIDDERKKYDKLTESLHTVPE